ncbi:GXWXG protein-domain-containing protein [Aspergillus taichungensis]|uniref:GXWXG protein-domain-containing protein n=1 Tax=Aspergillus taichungensis TaxID=482145 RepID=A0A2J5HM16_9EURO|nr:GXWXG protein-domain-containing protein [Aspergillus taichungensis]
MPTRLEDNLLKLVTEGQHVDASEVTALYDRLPPVSVQELLGEWQGLAIQTGHQDIGILDSIGWVGKTFHSANEVDPVIVLSPDGKRVAKGDWGAARVGLLSTAN